MKSSGYTSTFSIVTALGLVFGGVHAGWVDPDSPKYAQSTKAHTVGDDRHYKLVRRGNRLSLESSSSKDCRSEI